MTQAAKRSAFSILMGIGIVLACTNACSPGFVIDEQVLSLSSIAAAKTCVAANPPASAPSARLTYREYRNTMSSLFSRLSPGISGLTGGAPTDLRNSSHLVMEFDTTLRRAASQDDIESYAEVARLVAEEVANQIENSSNRGAVLALLGSDCLKNSSSVSDQCWSDTYAFMGRKIYRRPLTTEETAKLLELSKDAINATKYQGLSLAFQYLLQSYPFLYKFEGGTAAGLYALDDFEIATRLSYGLTATTPNDALLEAAAGGKLKDPVSRRLYVEALVASDEFRQGLDGFYAQWLRVADIPYFYQLGARGIDPNDLYVSVPKEMLQFTSDITRSPQGTYSDLMTSQTIYPTTDALAALYGVPKSTGAVIDSQQRRPGILTRVGWQMTPGDGIPSHVSRGVRLLTDMLCQSMGPPPDAAFTNIAAFDQLSSSRQQLIDKTASVSCMGCHSSINPAGFVFGNYDSFGQWRTQETVTNSGGATAVHPVATTGILRIDGQSLNFSTAQDAAQFMASSSVAKACMSKRYYQYASGNGSPSTSSCAVSTMSSNLARGGGTIVEMMKSYYLSDEIGWRNVKSPR